MADLNKQPKIIKKHPTHFKVSSWVGATLLVITLAAFVIGIFFQQKGQIELSHKFAYAFLIGAALLISWLVFRMKLCKCPSCGTMLHKLAPGDRHTSRKFICEQCNVIWETGYVMYFDFADPD
jgi:hypothetical protein